MKASVIVYFVLLIMLSYSSIAEVVVFSDYETQTRLEDDKLHIQRKLVLQNVGSNPIIPGELHFKLHELDGDKRVPSEVTGFKAVNYYDVVLKTRQIEGQEETDLIVSIWEPVLPKFTYTVFLEYDIKFQPKGLLFYELQVPIEETTIPIKDTMNSVYIPVGYHVTHAKGAEVKKVNEDSKDYRVVSWENKKEMVIEYSRLPLPRLGIRAVNVFWGVMIASTVAFTIILHRRLW